MYRICTSYLLSHRYLMLVAQYQPLHKAAVMFYEIVYPK